MMMACVSLAGCKTLNLGDALTDAAHQAVAEASIDIGPLPAECYADTSHTALVKGEELSVLLRRERAQLDAANGKRFRCASYHNDLRANLKGGH